ncbi:MAG: T9SS type A sorting domain-containing protein [Ignavibacteriae bacterium]|nr:T9SS type A sorting domain-containing protein [Ignavibacteriota bacterium]
METLQRFKFFVLLISVMLIFGGNLAAQTPQYYNYQDTGVSLNNFPFGMNTGKASSWLFMPGEFTKPAPAPPGKRITRIYFFIKTSTFSKPYTNLHILMKQDTITTFTEGQFYPGPWDTVFVADTTLNGTVNQWMGITLETKYNYDPTKSLLVFIGQCASSGNGGGTICQLEINERPRVRRVWSSGGCPFTPWATGDSKMPNFGIDVETITNTPEIEISIPASYKLEQNYPNPFNPVTKINFALPKAGFVSLKVYDMLGREVAVLVSENRIAGSHTVDFDASALQSGVFFYRLETDGFVDTKKMMVIK